MEVWGTAVHSRGGTFWDARIWVSWESSGNHGKIHGILMDFMGNVMVNHISFPSKFIFHGNFMVKHKTYSELVHFVWTVQKWWFHGNLWWFHPSFHGDFMDFTGRIIYETMGSPWWHQMNSLFFWWDENEIGIHWIHLVNIWKYHLVYG